MPTKPGAVVEIATSKGLAYAQLTHKHPKFGALLRVFEGFHRARPPSFEMIVRGPVQFQTFFPLDTAIRRKIVALVGREPLPPGADEFPLFRSGVTDHEGKVHQWWLWDGEKEWRIDGPLTEEQRHYPILWFPNDTALIHQIETGWRTEDVV